MRNARVFVYLPLLAIGSILIAGDRPGGAQQQSAIQRKTLLQQDSTVPGYQATVNIVEIPAGVSEVRHTHPGPLAVYVLEGTLILEHEGRPTTTYGTGEAALIEAGKIHRGINTTAAPLKLVATLITEKGKPASSLAP
jgi:quercetin dioxygenase-like cupin family protein